MRISSASCDIVAKVGACLDLTCLKACGLSFLDQKVVVLFAVCEIWKWPWKL